MLFTTPVFLFLFLPLLLGLYFTVRPELRNLLLLAGSLFFYLWGEKLYTLVLAASLVLNYSLGLLLERFGGPRHGAPWLMALAVLANLGLLAAFKYANFLADNGNVLLAAVGVAPVRLDPVHMPLGISFFTFHALSYAIDVFRREARALKNPIDFALYITFFPQAIAGPIVRYGDVASQLTGRLATEEGFAAGVRRFIIGLAKKMLVADTLAGPARAVFDLPPDVLTPGLAWLGAVCYTLQIYFDFSGYSDMAIGLAKLFGFDFKENFRYPYVSSSVTEFWRRWHISLSSWFRDYLYIPLGGNRHGTARTYANLLCVFLLCGLWHGASWTFLLWGLYHGAFLVLERMTGRPGTAWRPVRHAYTLLVVVVGWVLFRSETPAGAARFLTAMAGFAPGAGTAFYPSLYLNTEVVLALAVGLLGSTPLLPVLGRLGGAAADRAGPRWGEVWGAAFAFGRLAALVLLLGASVLGLAAGTYSPFLYFRF